MPTTTLKQKLETDFLSLHSYTPLHYMEVKLTRPVSNEEFRQATEITFEHALDHRTELLLVDISRTAAPEIADFNWLVSFFASLKNKLKLRRLAVLLPHDAVQRLIVEAVEERVKSYCEIQCFEKEDLAKIWLFS